MEMGAAAIMANTALATAGNLPLIALLLNRPLKPDERHILQGLEECLQEEQLLLIR